MTTLIHITSSPYQGLAAKEGLELALVLATFEQPVAFAFSGAGVALLLNEQQSSHQHGKALYKMLPSFEFYDIDKLYVPAIEVEGLSISPLATPVTHTEWQDILTRHACVLRF
ncbi:sulfur oxidation protein [Marinomonas agarivorans]|nr:sulfur oxidation protein [Marinomonas agarivorans]